MKRWIRPPRQVSALFLAMMILLAGALGWLGWRLLVQDRALEDQRTRERLESAADLIAATLLTELSEIEQQLAVLSTLSDAQLAPAAAEYAGRFGRNAIVTVMRPTAVQRYPEGRLLYYPVVPIGPDIPGTPFAAADAYEFRRRDYGRAVEALSRLARATERPVRAEALLRLGRNLRKAGRFSEAAAAYDSLARLGDVPVGGLPSELVARYARCILYAKQERHAELVKEASALNLVLQQAPWPITRAAFSFYLDEVRQWLATGLDSADVLRMSPPPADWARAGGVDALYSGWQTGRESEQQSSTGKQTLWIEEQPVFLVWRSSSERLIGLVADPVYFEQRIRAGTKVHLAITDVGGRSVLASYAEPSHLQAVRTIAETKLPWTLHVSGADPDAVDGESRNRRRLLLMGLVMVALLVGLSFYFIARALARELEVTHLQTRFVAAVSHEFRTPLTSMRQLTEMLAAGRVANEERRQTYYQVLLQESQRLHRLVESLLDFGRMEAGAMEYQRTTIDGSALVRDVVEAFEKEVQDRGHHVELTRSLEDAYIEADPEAFSRALWNLLDNAVKYAPESPIVRVELEKQPGYLAVHVRDRGPGIPAHEQREIFKKFVRGSGSEASGKKGTGIGLAMVQHIVEWHGGHVAVASSPGAGSTFTLSWPLAE